jgi:hypothetical protein
VMCIYGHGGMTIFGDGDGGVYLVMVMCIFGVGVGGMLCVGVAGCKYMLSPVYGVGFC